MPLEVAVPGNHAADSAQWNVASVDITGFAGEIQSLREEVYASISNSDFEHLRKIERCGRFFSFLGYATAWIIPNPISALTLSLGQCTRWLLAHHILHRGYDNVPGVPERYTSRGFARGWRRFVDWFDWIHPSAWDYEHNVLHHYNTGEERDPDLAERHTEFLRRARLPRSVKYLALLLAAFTWKFTYYAPNTLSVLDAKSQKRLKSENIIFLTIGNIFQFRNGHVRALWQRCYLPYALFHFGIVPLAFFPLGWSAVIAVLMNKIVAEGITNFHSFLVIAPNHTAEDLYRYDFHYGNKAEFYATQVLGSCNYRCGTALVDYLSIWLNYQIEHHLFPDLPMSKYSEIQPRVKELCQRYGLPYKQESVFRRFWKMMDVCVGKAKLREMQEFAATDSLGA